MRIITQYRDKNEKAQIIAGLREAVENTDTIAIREALLDLILDYENDKRIFYVNLPGELWGEDNNIIIYEDISDLPVGNATIEVSTVDDKESWIFELQIEADVLFVEQYTRGVLIK